MREVMALTGYAARGDVRGAGGYVGMPERAIVAPWPAPVPPWRSNGNSPDGIAPNRAAMGTCPKAFTSGGFDEAEAQ